MFESIKCVKSWQLNRQKRKKQAVKMKKTRISLVRKNILCNDQAPIRRPTNEIPIATKHYW